MKAALHRAGKRAGLAAGYIFRVSPTSLEPLEQFRDLGGSRRSCAEECVEIYVWKTQPSHRSRQIFTDVRGVCRRGRCQRAAYYLEVRFSKPVLFQT